LNEHKPVFYFSRGCFAIQSCIMMRVGFFSKFVQRVVGILLIAIITRRHFVCSFSSSSQQQAANNNNNISDKMNTNPERPSQFYPEFFKSLPSMEGKTIVITGCSQGLGYVTASAVAKKGGFVIMLNRRSDQAKKAFAAISRDAVGIPPEMIECDLQSFESVRTACKAIRERTAGDNDDDGGIDVLCCNAGIMLQPDEASADGYDITASTNMLSHFLLTKELFGELQKASSLRGEARIVSMSSGSGYGSPAFNPSFFERRGGKLGGNRNSYERYHQSKLANLAFTAALNDRLRAQHSKIKAVACTPGVCGTNMYAHAIAVMNGAGKPGQRNTVPSAEDGSMAQLKCIFDPTIESGDCWGPKMGSSTGELESTFLGPPHILADQDTKRALWKVCEEAVGRLEL